MRSDSIFSNYPEDAPQQTLQVYTRHLSPARRGTILSFPRLERSRLLPSASFTSDTDLFSENPDRPRRPIVLLFYTPRWPSPNAQVAFLETLGNDIQIMGGEFLVISPVPIYFWKRISGPERSFSVYADTDNGLAHLAGLYDYFNPTWKWMSGIEENTPLPALFVASPNGKIRFRYIDAGFSLYRPQPELPVNLLRRMLTQVYRYNPQAARAAS